MQSALLFLLGCAAVDIIACGLLLVIVWVVHRRMRKEAAQAGEVLPSASGQLRWLFALGSVGLAGVCAAAWLLLQADLE